MSTKNWLSMCLVVIGIQIAVHGFQVVCPDGLSIWVQLLIDMGIKGMQWFGILLAMFSFRIWWHTKI